MRPLRPGGGQFLDGHREFDLFLGPGTVVQEIVILERTRRKEAVSRCAHLRAFGGRADHFPSARSLAPVVQEAIIDEVAKPLGDARRPAARKTTAKKKTAAKKKTTRRTTAKKKTTTKKAAAKKSTTIKGSADPRTKSQIFNTLADATEMSRKEITTVIGALESMIVADLKKGTAVKLMGMKMTVKKKPATKARKGRNPFTGEEMMFKVNQ